MLKEDENLTESLESGNQKLLGHLPEQFQWKVEEVLIKQVENYQMKKLLNERQIQVEAQWSQWKQRLSTDYGREILTVFSEHYCRHKINKLNLSMSDFS